MGAGAAYSECMINEEKPQEGERSISTVSTILPTGELVELVYDPEKRQTALAVGSPGVVSIEESVEFGDRHAWPLRRSGALIMEKSIDGADARRWT